MVKKPEPNASAPLKGVRHGSYIGPTGRKRKLYEIKAYNRSRDKVGGNYAYGSAAVPEAKQAIRKQEERHVGHTVWLKYLVYGRKV